MGAIVVVGETVGSLVQIVPESHVRCGEGKREGRGDVVGPGLGTLLMLGDDDGAGLVDGCADGGMEGPAVGGGSAP